VNNVEVKRQVNLHVELVFAHVVVFICVGEGVDSVNVAFVHLAIVVTVEQDKEGVLVTWGIE
jgi:hypothetical protein